MPAKQPIILSLIVLSFFFAGFLTVAILVEMDPPEIAFGLVVGIIGPLTMVFFIFRARPGEHQNS